MKLLYPAIFTPFDDGNGFTVEVPDLPGCVTEGGNLIEAIEMGTDAASGWILDEIKAPVGSFVNLLVLDIDSYAEQYGNKAVRRNITVPAWLDTYAQKNHLSLSRLVQDTLLTLAQQEK